jgi:hypothetical protein
MDRLYLQGLQQQLSRLFHLSAAVSCECELTKNISISRIDGDGSVQLGNSFSEFAGKSQHPAAFEPRFRVFGLQTAGLIEVCSRLFEATDTAQRSTPQLQCNHVLRIRIDYDCQIFDRLFGRCLPYASGSLQTSIEVSWRTRDHDVEVRHSRSGIMKLQQGTRTVIASGREVRLLLNRFAKRLHGQSRLAGKPAGLSPTQTMPLAMPV